MPEPSLPRLPPLPREQWNDDVHAAIRAGLPPKAAAQFLATDTDRHVPNVLTSLMYHPRLTGPFLAFNAVLLREGALAPRLRELMVLRAAWRVRAEYEWVQHVRMAPRVNIAQAEVEAITQDPPVADWTPLEAALLAATDQLIDATCIADETWSVLAAELDDAQLLEVPFVVGTYVALAMVLNSIGVELDPDLDRGIAPAFPTTDPLRTAEPATAEPITKEHTS